MNIKQINEKLEDLLETYQLNEMAIYYGTDHGNIKDVAQGFKKLVGLKEGMVHVNQILKVDKEVTQEEINANLFDAVQKGIAVTRQYPIVLVWGEPDKRKGNKYLEGHGLVHMLQGHQKDLSKCISKLQSVINNGTSAKYDKHGNYTVRVDNFRFAFMLEDNKDLTPKWAVLVTAYIR